MCGRPDATNRSPAIGRPDLGIRKNDAGKLALREMG